MRTAVPDVWYTVAYIAHTTAFAQRSAAFAQHSTAFLQYSTAFVQHSTARTHIYTDITRNSGGPQNNPPNIHVTKCAV